jgi:hypothetical protein
MGNNQRVDSVVQALSLSIYKHLYSESSMSICSGSDVRVFKQEMLSEIQEWLHGGEYPEVVSIEELAEGFNHYWLEG